MKTASIMEGLEIDIRDKTSLLLAKNEAYHILLKRYLGDKELAKAATEKLFKGAK